MQARVTVVAMTRMVGKFIVAWALMVLLAAVLHEALIFGVASQTRQIDIDGLARQIDALPLGTDVVHTHLVLSTLTSIRPRGLAVAGPPGQLLHAVYPAFFLEPTHAMPGAAISAVISRGSSLLALFLTRVIVEMLLIAFGALCLRVGLRQGRGPNLVQHPRFTLSWLAAFGLFLQAQATLAVIKMMPSRPELDYMGIGVVVDNLLPGNAGGHDSLADQFLPVLISLLVIGVGFSLVPFILALGRAARQAWVALRPQRTRAAVTDRQQPSAPALAQTRLVGFVLMLALAVVLPTGIMARTNSGFTQPNRRTATVDNPIPHVKSTPIANQIVFVATSSPTASPTATPAATSVVISATPLPVPTGAVSPTLLAASTRAVKPTATVVPTKTPTAVPVAIVRSTEQPRVINIHRSPARADFMLTNGKGEVITLRGVNYNTHYTTLPKDEHIKILRRDFAQMRAAGVNVITGYATFNEVTLEVAQEYDIGVIMPYLPDLNGDYLDSAYREQVKIDFTAFTKRYENYTSLLMWNFDDEPVHNMLERLQRPPEQAQAFADLLFELAAHAYDTDRYHRPSWLKEPRDWYLDIYSNSIAKMRKQVQDAAAQGKTIPDPNRYAVMARSAYGTPLDVNDWLPKLHAKVEGELNMPFAIGEYGVVGMDADDRGVHLAEIWSEAHDNSVLGSAVYTYGPFQPDPGDPTPPGIAAQLMLVDENGTPIDDAWERLSRLWLAQQVEEVADTRHSSIPVGASAFQQPWEQYGGYPSSELIKDDNTVRQFFVEGTQAGRMIAYVLEWDASTQMPAFSTVDRVVFDELGEFVLTGEFLQVYMTQGGYARFGAPVSGTHETKQNGKVYTAQQFAKGWTFLRESKP